MQPYSTGPLSLSRVMSRNSLTPCCFPLQYLAALYFFQNRRSVCTGTMACSASARKFAFCMKSMCWSFLTASFVASTQPCQTSLPQSGVLNILSVVPCCRGFPTVSVMPRCKLREHDDKRCCFYTSMPDIPSPDRCPEYSTCCALLPWISNCICYARMQVEGA